MKRLVYGLLVCCIFAAGSARAQDSQQAASDEAPIRQLVAKYAEAFNKGDAKALADMWSQDAVYTNRLTGESVQGRAEITKQFEALFAKVKGVKLSLQTEAIQFLSPNVAVEHGSATFVTPSGKPEENNYTAIYVKRDGQWLMDRVTDEEKPVEVSNYEHLKPLEWMVGSWTSDLPVAEMQLDCSWTANRNFLTRSFKIRAGKVDFSGVQIIGWDPQAKNIRSWTFDSNGTFAEATWTNKGKQWFLHNKGVLADGTKASMVNVMKMVDENSFTWQTIDRTAGGELLPNIDEVLVVRQ